MRKTKEEIPSFFCEPIAIDASSEEWERVFRWVEFATKYYVRINGTNPWFSEVKTQKMYLQISNLFDFL